MSDQEFERMGVIVDPPCRDELRRAGVPPNLWASLKSAGQFQANDGTRRRSVSNGP